MSETAKNKLEIYTLGNFLVKRGEKLLSEDSGRSQKLWGLFKYLLTQRGKNVLPEDLMDALWAEDEYERSESAIKTLVYRLRRLLKNGQAGEDLQHINSSHGGYSWNSQSEYWLDAEEFEGWYDKARKSLEESDKRAEEYFRKALDLYKGDYLREFAYNDWVVPVSNYYRRLYLECIIGYLELLKKESRFGEVSGVCEKAFRLEPLDEDLHLRYLESLLEEGKTRQAQAHYENVTAALYREMGAKPSEGLRELYRRIKNREGGVELDLNLIQESLKDRQRKAGAFLCDPETFRFLYKLEGRRVVRSGQVIYLALITLTLADYSLPGGKDLKGSMDALEQALMGSLRKGDVVCRWNQAQFICLLPGLTFEQSRKVLERIEGKYRKEFKEDKVVLRFKVQPLHLLEEQ